MQQRPINGYAHARALSLSLAYCVSSGFNQSTVTSNRWSLKSRSLVWRCSPTYCASTAVPPAFTVSSLHTVSPHALCESACRRGACCAGEREAARGEIRASVHPCSLAWNCHLPPERVSSLKITGAASTPQAFSNVLSTCPTTAARRRTSRSP